MPHITIEVETGDNTIVGTRLILASMPPGGGSATEHELVKPVSKAKASGSNPFVYRSQDDLPSGKYGLRIVLKGSGRSAKATVADATLVVPIGGEWPFELEVPANRTQRSDTCWFTV